ncbi:hypothetical protein KUV85_12790 [Nocardioides panacisoli]|uniref:sensor histidine kinase n=1 Tax=Nocardioides panacisoli TaxID=627624 RepID=UPI001C6397B5|nr:histidine kinase [Nocardioides panacisoli]QYJ03208.1 hypothetical protein KUV85_12790 [Nocardioides panacisoli]
MMARLRRRIDEECAGRGLLYPWWVPLISFIAQVVCVLLALGLRDALWPLGPLHLTLLLVAVTPVVQLGFGRWLPWYLDPLGSLLAAGLLLATPVAGELSALDAAPALLMFATAESTARDGIRQGGVVGAVSAALLAVAAAYGDLAGVGVHLLTVLLGHVVGAMLLWQMRALAAERAARERAWQQATLAERQRIAREIHDLVAHSLSVTLLHLTGARHALRDLAGAGDGASPGAGDGDGTVAEVDAALGDAEQIGRQAIADIRRTVGALADGPAETHPLPGAEGIEGLVQQMRDAGMRVTYDGSGPVGSLPPVAGLGLYRIAQESLANVAKHAATAAASVEVRVTGRGARMVVRNELVGADPLLGRISVGEGSGLAGMATRARQLGGTLTSGPEGRDWVVDLRLPARTVAPAPARPEVRR